MPIDTLLLNKVVLLILTFLFCGKLVNWLVPLVRRWLVARLGANLQPDAATLNHIEGRARTLGLALRKGSVIAIRIVTSIWLLSLLGVDTTPISAAVGVFGVALGFGAQALVQDVLAGVYILLENRFHLHDVVEINGVRGRVVDMTYRTIVLKESAEHHIHIFQNGKINTLIVHRKTKST